MIDTLEIKQKNNLFDIVSVHTNLKKVASTGGGEYAGSCPFCGGDDRFRVQPYNDCGKWFCRQCSPQWGDVIDYIKKSSGCDFKEAVSILGGGELPKPVHIKIEKPSAEPTDYFWKGWGYVEYEKNFYHHRLLALWRQYKPLKREHIDNYCLGYGVLPLSSCRHNRLIVPIFNKDGKLVCLRGRRIECDCPQKWSVSKGFVLDDIKPYNYENIKSGGVVVVVENPIDAIMIDKEVIKLIAPQLSQKAVKALIRDTSMITGVATLSVSYWRENWANTLKKGVQIIVAYDNDLPGNGGGANHNAWAKEWINERGHKAPEPRGVKLVNALKGSSSSVVLLDWGNRPRKYDIGEWISENVL